MKYTLVDIVDNTVTNASGYCLFILMDKAINSKEVIKLSFRDTIALSSSFLNSSFGSLLDKYDFDTIKKFVKLIEMKRGIANQVSNYLHAYSISF
jgi:hypothetical protein